MQEESTTEHSLEQRIGRLERQNRRYRLGGAILVLASAAALCIGMSAPRKTLETDLLLIKDANGTTRMILGMADDGPAITMLDEKGKLRANIGVTAKGPEFDFLDASETPRLSMSIDDKQVPRVNLLDSKGTQVTFRP
ncbi:MAG TPA: hypothetical protein VE326_10480 [Candidatus Binatia bacterium]|nr:hypothetical protein [Candidatus Binatia bacterium]